MQIHLIWPPLRKYERSQNYILFVCLFCPGKILKFRIDIVNWRLGKAINSQCHVSVNMSGHGCMLTNLWIFTLTKNNAISCSCVYLVRFVDAVANKIFNFKEHFLVIRQIRLWFLFFKYSHKWGLRDYLSLEFEGQYSQCATLVVSKEKRGIYSC